MTGHNSDNNSIFLIGRVGTDFVFNHRVHGEGFYNCLLEVPRLSDSFDRIPITISERLLNNFTVKPGDNIQIEGQFRSYNNYTSEGNKLMLTVFVRNMEPTDDYDRAKNPNQIVLNGYICKKPIYRVTPFGREITDILLAVNRPYNKSDYIPCIAWGRNARFSETLKVGENIKIWGRIQSRDYQKKSTSGEITTKVAYEISISKLEIVTRKQ